MSINRGKDKQDMVHIHNGIYHSAIKRNETVSFAEMWMDLETVIWSEVSQRKKNIYTLMRICRSRQTIDDLICKAEIETQM